MEFVVSHAEVWFIIGLFLFIVELLSLQFFLIFFGISAIVVSISNLLGMTSIGFELAVFGITGIVGIVFFRKKILGIYNRKSSFSIDENQKIILDQDLPAGAHGKLEYQGSFWTVINDGESVLLKGDQVSVKRVEGVTLYVIKSLNK